MPRLIHELIEFSAQQSPEAEALVDRQRRLSYAQLDEEVRRAAGGMARLGLARYERVAVLLPKTTEAVVAMFGATRAGGAFVPVNPVLKPRQVRHILRDCNVRLLVTSRSLLSRIESILPDCHDLRWVVTVDDTAPENPDHDSLHFAAWHELLAGEPRLPAPGTIDQDMAAILYTSGSTGKPKGVVLSHQNLVAGAESVIQYLGKGPDERILCVLPLSFDYGLSQVTTALRCGGTAVLLDYLLPGDIRKAVKRERITGLAGVPSLWHQIAHQPWLEELDGPLRYITNSGGALPAAVLERLRAGLPGTEIFLMYGLTEAFRSTYLPPEELDRRPDSIGIPIPGAEITVINDQGEPAACGEPGELVHRGCHVALGYWNDPERTAERFRPAPRQLDGLPVSQPAVWSGDRVRRDAGGYLYFLGRDDSMIKTSGYRVSPTEVEEAVYTSGQVKEAAAIGIPDEQLGEAIVVVAEPTGASFDPQAILAHCREELPNYMVPRTIVDYGRLPHTPNGKVDRRQLREQFCEEEAGSDA